MRQHLTQVQTVNIFIMIFLKIDTANVLTEAQIKLMLFMSLTAVIDALGPMDINLVIVRSVRVLITKAAGSFVDPA